MIITILQICSLQKPLWPPPHRSKRRRSKLRRNKLRRSRLPQHNPLLAVQNSVKAPVPPKSKKKKILPVSQNLAPDVSSGDEQPHPEDDTKDNYDISHSIQENISGEAPCEPGTSSTNHLLPECVVGSECEGSPIFNPNHDPHLEEDEITLVGERHSLKADATTYPSNAHSHDVHDRIFQGSIVKRRVVDCSICRSLQWKKKNRQRYRKHLIFHHPGQGYPFLISQIDNENQKVFGHPCRSFLGLSKLSKKGENRHWKLEGGDGKFAVSNDKNRVSRELRDPDLKINGDGKMKQPSHVQKKGIWVQADQLEMYYGHNDEPVELELEGLQMIIEYSCYPRVANGRG